MSPKKGRKEALRLGGNLLNGEWMVMQQIISTLPVLRWMWIWLCIDYLHLQLLPHFVAFNGTQCDAAGKPILAQAMDFKLLSAHA
jgi:hypothetical protein